MIALGCQYRGDSFIHNHLGKPTFSSVLFVTHVVVLMDDMFDVCTGMARGWVLGLWVLGFLKKTQSKIKTKIGFIETLGCNAGKFWS